MRIIFWVLASYILVSVWPVLGSEVENGGGNKQWTGKLRNGEDITKGDLDWILAEHKIWLDGLEEFKTLNKEKLSNWDDEALLNAYEVWRSETHRRGKMAVLSGVSLEGADLRHANLERAYLWEVNLKGASLDRANLKGAELIKANLEGAWLVSANLEGSHLEGANFKGAWLWEANLIGAFMDRVSFKGAWLNEANLKGAHLEEALLSKVSLNKANLEGVNLNRADLEGASLWKANLRGANLKRANLKGAGLVDADLMGAEMDRVNLEGAFLGNANLEDAKLMKANLEGAELVGTNLKGAYLWWANLKGANFYHADLKDVIFELKSHSTPNIQMLTTATNLHLLTYKYSPHSLLELRHGFKEQGLRKQERAISYAIHHNRIEKMVVSEVQHDTEIKRYVHWRKLPEYLLNFALFEVTCKWGMKPLRPIWIIFFSICFFSTYYRAALLNGSRQNGIWKVWHENRVNTDFGQKKPILLRLKGRTAFWYGLYFSMLSAFHIGWREINVEYWITRIQVDDYSLKATGKARIVAGIQSLLSLYLIVLSIMTYFGSPFE